MLTCTFNLLHLSYLGRSTVVMHLVKILFVFNARRVKIVTSDPVYRDKISEQPIGIISEGKFRFMYVQNNLKRIQ